MYFVDELFLVFTPLYFSVVILDDVVYSFPLYCSYENIQKYLIKYLKKIIRNQKMNKSRIRKKTSENLTNQQSDNTVVFLDHSDAAK